MKKKGSKDGIRFDITDAGFIPLPGEMPSPPPQLIRDHESRRISSVRELLEEKSSDKAQKNSDTSALFTPALQTQDFISTPVMQPTTPPKTIEYSLYKTAVDERSRSEMQYAETYSRLLDLTEFNEKLLRTVRRYQNYRRRVRTAYDALQIRAQNGDQEILDNLRLTQRNLRATEKALNDLQIDNEALTVSVRAHEEGYQLLLSRLGAAEAALETAHKQFQSLVEEFELRGQLLQDADRKIRMDHTEIQQLHAIVDELTTRQQKMRDDVTYADNKIRELQLRESGVIALNAELTDAVTKSQKQVHLLEDRLREVTLESQLKIAELQSEVDRLREGKRADALIEKSKQVQAGQNPPPLAKEIHPVSEVVKNAATLSNKANPRSQWNDFYNRWSQIIDGLSTHSTPIHNLNATESEFKGELVNDLGEIEIL